MALRLTREPETWMEVRWQAPVQDGRLGTVSFDLKVALIGVEAAKALQGDDEEQVKASFRRIIRDCRKIEDEDGNELAFSSEVLDQLLDIVAFAPAFLRAYLPLIAGEGRRKN